MLPSACCRPGSRSTIVRLGRRAQHDRRSHCRPRLVCFSNQSPRTAFWPASSLCPQERQAVGFAISMDRYRQMGLHAGRNETDKLSPAALISANLALTTLYISNALDRVTVERSVDVACSADSSGFLTATCWSASAISVSVLEGPNAFAALASIKAADLAWPGAAYVEFSIIGRWRGNPTPWDSGHPKPAWHQGVLGVRLRRPIDVHHHIVRPRATVG